MENTGELDLRKEVLDSCFPVYVCFTAPWCRTCYPACLVASELKDDYQGQIKFVEIDVEKYASFAEEYEVKAVPTILIFVNGRPARRILSYQEKALIKDVLDTIMAGNQ